MTTGKVSSIRQEHQLSPPPNTLFADGRSEVVPHCLQLLEVAHAAVCSQATMTNRGRNGVALILTMVQDAIEYEFEPPAWRDGGGE